MRRSSRKPLIISRMVIIGERAGGKGVITYLTLNLFLISCVQPVVQLEVRTVPTAYVIDIDLCKETTSLLRGPVVGIIDKFCNTSTSRKIYLGNWLMRNSSPGLTDDCL